MDPDYWFHRGPCCVCSVCGQNGCLVWNPNNGQAEVHVCAGGCDGLDTPRGDR